MSDIIVSNNSDKPKNKGGRPKGSKDKFKRLPHGTSREQRQNFLVAVTDLAKLQFKDTGEALKYLLARECEIPTFNGMSNREAIARVLLTLGMEGDVSALKIILDRVDGKLLDTPPISIQTVILSSQDQTPDTRPKLAPDFIEMDTSPALPVPVVPEFDEAP